MCVCLVCRVLLCRGCNPRLSRVRRSLNPRAPQSAQSLSRPGSPHRAARRGCGAGHQPGDCAAAGREAAKSALRNYPVPLLSPPAGPLGVPKMPKLLRNKAGKQCKFDPPCWGHSKKDSKSCSFEIMQSWDMSRRLLGHPGY